jgi:cytochrome c oxidase subunit 2
VQTDVIRLWLTVALAGALAIATVAVNRSPTVETNAAPAPGASLFQTKGCSGCHTLAGVSTTASVGPNLSDVAAVAGQRIAGMSAADYIRQSLRDPQGFIVPGFEAVAIDMPALSLTEAEVNQLIELLLNQG